jgi:hypothetical protein
MARRRGVGRAAVSLALLCTVVGCGHPREPSAPTAQAVQEDRPLEGGGTAALSECGTSDRHFPGPSPSPDASTPQMVMRGYGYSSTGANDPGYITITVSIAAGSERPMTLSRPLGSEGPSVEIQGPDGTVAAAYGLPVKITHEPAGELEVGRLPLDFQIVLPADAACPGHSLSDVMRNTTASGGGSATLAVTISDPAIGRHRAAHGLDASSDLLVATWPTNPTRPGPVASASPSS